MMIDLKLGQDFALNEQEKKYQDILFNEVGLGQNIEKDVL